MTAAGCGWCERAPLPPFPDRKGFVGGSMGDRSVILEGVDSGRERAGPLLHRPRRRPGHVPDPCRRQDPVQEGEAGPHLGGGNQPGHDAGLDPRHGSGAPRGRDRRISPLLQTAARMSWKRIGAPSGSCTRSTPSAWPWPPRASSTPIGIESAASSGTPSAGRSGGTLPPCILQAGPPSPTPHPDPASFETGVGRRVTFGHETQRVHERHVAGGGSGAGHLQAR